MFQFPIHLYPLNIIHYQETSVQELENAIHESVQEMLHQYALETKRVQEKPKRVQFRLSVIFNKQDTNLSIRMCMTILKKSFIRVI